MKTITETLKNDVHEITDQIYDTIMDNVGMSEHHVRFDVARVVDSEVNAIDGYIDFTTKDGASYRVVIKAATA